MKRTNRYAQKISIQRKLQHYHMPSPDFLELRRYPCFVALFFLALSLEWKRYLQSIGHIEKPACSSGSFLLVSSSVNFLVNSSYSWYYCNASIVTMIIFRVFLCQGFFFHLNIFQIAFEAFLLGTLGNSLCMCSSWDWVFLKFGFVYWFFHFSYR